MPPAPPLRTVDNDYYYYAYDYNGSSVPWGRSPAQPTRDGNEFYSMRRDLAGLRAYGASIGVPNIAATPVGGPTADGRDTMVLSFGSGTRDAPTVVITGGIHSNEWMAAALAYLIAEYLIRNYAPGQAGNQYQRTLSRLVETRNIFIAPMLNPDGNYYSIFYINPNVRYWRKNLRPLPDTAAGWEAALAPGGAPRAPFVDVEPNPPPPAAPLTVNYKVPTYNGVPPIPPGGPPDYKQRRLPIGQDGVDLNRNCSTLAWGYDCKPRFSQSDPATQAYFGTAPGTEPETANMQYLLFTLATTGAPIATGVDYHAFGRMIIYPPESFDIGAVGAEHRTLGRTMQQLIRPSLAAAPDYRLGNVRDLITYDATGGLIDHAKQRYQARTFSIEADPAYLPFDPTKFQPARQQIRAVFEKNIRAALALIAAPPPAPSGRRRRFNRREIGRWYLEFLNWDVYGRGNQLPL